MGTLTNAPLYYALDPNLEQTYRESARKYYGFTPSISFRQLMRNTQTARLQSVVGMDIDFPELSLSRTNWQYRSHPRNPAKRYVSIDMSVEWGGNWGFRALTSRGVVERLVKGFMAERYPQVQLAKVWYDLHAPISGYYETYPAVESVEICYIMPQ